MNSPKPKPTQCHHCGAWAAVAICNFCRTERPAYTALKNISAAMLAPYPQCRYFPKSLCGCGERGLCLEAA